MFAASGLAMVLARNVDGSAGCAIAAPAKTTTTSAVNTLEPNARSGGIASSCVDTFRQSPEIRRPLPKHAPATRFAELGLCEMARDLTDGIHLRIRGGESNSRLNDEQDARAEQ